MPKAARRRSFFFSFASASWWVSLTTARGLPPSSLPCPTSFSTNIWRKVATFCWISSPEYPCSSIMSSSSIQRSSTRRLRSWSRMSWLGFFTRLDSSLRSSSSDL